MLDLTAHAPGEDDRAALVLPSGDVLNRRELSRLVSRVARVLDRPAKSLVMCLGDADLGTVLAYLAALRSGHSVAFLQDLRALAADVRHSDVRLILDYRPEFVVVPDTAPGETTVGSLAATLAELGYDHVAMNEPRFGIFRWRDPGSRGHIDDDVALLLGTSGSTGSPRAVRISYEGIRSNTDAIIAALGIRPADRAITSVPIRHGYGLSVLNTHLRAGASVVLDEGHPTTLRFWHRVIRTGVTTIAAVPATYRAWGERHFDLLAQSSVSTMTMSGGALSPELTLRLAAFMAARGGRFFVQYGQTEATARMACLDPRYLPERVGSVGRAIPGGVLTIDVPESDGQDQADRPREGEVCYDGPGVMLGYADNRAGLGRPPDDIRPLRTGDIGYLDDGFLYLTGRLKRISKLFGQRVNLDDVERMLASDVVVVADDEKIFIVTTEPAENLAAGRKLVHSTLGIPSGCVVVRQVDAVPRTPSGKVDYPAVLRGVTA